MASFVSRAGLQQAAVRLRGVARPLSAPPMLRIAGLVVGGCISLPLVYLVVRAAGVSPESFESLMRPATFAILWRSLILAATVTVASVMIAVPLAWLTVRSDLPGRRVWSVLAILPLVIPSYVGAFALVAALGPQGILRDMLAGPFGIERLPDITGFPGAALALTLFAYPYVLLSVRAGLRGLDPAMEEAARGLGDTSWQALWRVTLPHLRPSLASGGLLVALYVLSDFGAVSMLRYTTFTRAIYLQYRASFDRSLAALLALALVVITIVIISIEGRAAGRATRYRQAATVRHPRRVSLGRWRWPALIFCALIVTIALGVPISVIVLWLVRGLAAGEPVGLLWGAALRSIYASGLAAGVAVLAALPVAVLAVRHPDRLTRLVEKGSFAGYALPGIVVALSLVFFGANYVAPLYQTLFLLVFAYVVRFLPQAVGALRTSLLQVSPRIEEAAQGLGRSRNGVMLSITLPMMRPGLTAGAALVFLTAMKELPATLLLGPTGYDTLATRVWSATEEAFYGRAAGPALLLVLVSALSVWFILAGDREPQDDRV